MKRILFVLAFVALTAAWCPMALAQRQAAVGPGQIPLDATGMLNGVDLSASGITGTLVVGVPGGPETDIFTSNIALNPMPLAVSTAASSQGNITFNSSSTVFGAVGVTPPGGAFLLNLAGGNAGTAINFQGPVFATTLNVSGTGTVNFNSGSTNVTATNFAAAGTIGLAPNTTVIGALTTTAGANTGSLVLGGGSVLNGAVGGAIGLKSIAVVGGSNLAGVSATVTGALDAFSLSLGTSTLNVGGALTIANLGATGQINTTLASPTVFGSIRPAGATNLGPALLVNVTVPATSFLPVGTQFDIVQSQTGTPQSGTDGSVITVTDLSNPLYTFSAVPPAGTVAGLVEIQVTGIPLVAVPAPIGPALIAAAPSVLAPLGALTNPGAVAGALAQLVPSAPALAAPLVTFEGSRELQDLWASRLDDALCGQIQVRQLDQENASCRKNEPGSGWWVKGFGYFGSQGNRNSFAGYDSEIGGGMMAYDAPLGPDTRVGLGVGYTRSSIDGRSFDSSTDFDTYTATAYIGQELGPWYVYGAASFGWNDYSGSRHVSFPGFDRTAQSSYSGQAYTGYATTGYHFFVQDFTLTPLASLQYTHVDLGGYAESGGGDIDLKVASQSYDFVESGLGVSAARPFPSRNGTFVPELHAKWLHELNNPTLQNNAMFTAAVSPTFNTQGLRTADDTFNVGAGLTFLSCACTARTWSLEAVYDYYRRTDDYSAHRVLVKLSGRF